jgi:thioesterase domain-containing protein/acyl carrier protein
MANPAFDVFTGDWARARGSGGALVFCPREILLDPPALLDLMRRERVDMAEFVPAVVETLIPHLERTGQSLDFMRLIAVGSDVWHAGEYERLRRLAGPEARVVSSYGLTEATIDSTYFEGTLADRPANRPVPIGRPLAGARVYVLDANLRPVPVGVPGELHVGGSALARGYHRRAGLTAERFVPDPFAGDPGARMYRTGDQARWLPDGNLELLGRLDHQVKVRGHRVELGEVEAALLRLPDVREAVAVVAADRSLAAYVVPREGRAIAPDALRRALHELLPRPMIPSALRVLDRFPLTPSGKVDRNALAAIDPGRSTREGEVVAPRDDIERALVAIWEELLNVRPIGVTDDFFDLGGHSLLAVRMTARIEERFGRRLPLSVLFLEATIEDLAATLREGPREAGGAKSSSLVAIRPEGDRSPLFLVHPIGGNVLCYHELARHLDPSRPVYGLQAAGLEGDSEPVADLAAMAARYVAAVREVQPTGPYHLGGWSLGGVVAFEMARQLEEAGEAVATLALIDSRAPGDGSRPSIDDAQLRAAFLVDLARGRGEAVPAGAVATTSWRLAAELGPERLRNLEAVFRANTRALLGYRPAPIAGRALLFRTGGSRLDRTLGWSALAGRGVAAHPLEGDHYSLLRPPTVEALARLLDAALNAPAAQANGQGVEPGSEPSQAPRRS